MKNRGSSDEQLSQGLHTASSETGNIKDSTNCDSTRGYHDRNNLSPEMKVVARYFRSRPGLCFHWYLLCLEPNQQIHAIALYFLQY